MTAGEMRLVAGGRPLLRWAGGKRWLVPRLPQLLGGLEFAAYHEPFLGGASVFLGLEIPRRSYLSDLNADLIETYRSVRDAPQSVADRLRRYVNTSEEYYEVRRQSPGHPDERAARFIYLNHTSFNGLYRVNLNGDYNVPYGHRKSPQIPGFAELEAASRRLVDADLSTGDFAECVRRVGEGDLVFLDPPYTVDGGPVKFAKYDKRRFSFEDQRRLSAMIDEIKAKRAYYVMTNAAHPSIAKLFEKGDRRIDTSRRNSMGSSSAARGSSMEYLFTNIDAWPDRRAALGVTWCLASF